MPATLSIKNVPDEVLERLRRRAKLNHRSLQGELMEILERATELDPLTVRELREINQSLGVHSDSDSTELVRAMRDARHGG